MVGGTRVRVGVWMKYLGFMLNSHWRFGAHFEDPPSRGSDGRLGPPLAKSQRVEGWGLPPRGWPSW